jgi:Holliday junction resolvase RusA-like endonuclease
MSNEVFKAIIELPKFPIKKNSKAIFRNKATGRPFIASNSKAQNLMNILNAELLKAKMMNKCGLIDYDVNVKFVFAIPQKHYYTRDGKRSKKIPDLTNLIEAPQDGMQHVGIIANDNLIFSLDGSCRIPTSSENHTLLIVITKIDISERIKKI